MNIASTQSYRSLSQDAEEGRIVAEGLSFSYPGGAQGGTKALDNINLKVNQGEVMALLGPSGCGKSTLLYLIGGFLTPTSGRITEGGTQVTGPDRRRGIVFQHFALFPWKTVAANIGYGLKRMGMDKATIAEKVQQHIDLVGLTGFENRFPSQLSGGMRQRAAIARTLAIDPAVLLMDEPFGALDALTRQTLQRELLSILAARPKTVIFVTHDVHEAALISDRVAVMSARPGRIAQIVETPFRRDPEPQRHPGFQATVDNLWQAVTHEAASAKSGRV